MKYKLSDEVKDSVTDFQGIITMIYLYLDEPPRYLVQPKCDVSYILPEAEIISEKRLILISTTTNLKGVSNDKPLNIY